MIVSSVQALSEMVPDGCGLVVEKGSVTELADAIVQADDPTTFDFAENVHLRREPQLGCRLPARRRPLRRTDRLGHFSV